MALTESAVDTFVAVSLTNRQGVEVGEVMVGVGAYMLVCANLASSGSKSPPQKQKYSPLIFCAANFTPP